MEVRVMWEGRNRSDMRNIERMCSRYVHMTRSEKVLPLLRGARGANWLIGARGVKLAPFWVMHGPPRRHCLDH